MKRLELTGGKYWFWTVVSFHGISDNGHSQWNCLCECGNQKVITGWNLRSGHSKSCGCKTSELIINSITTHGLAKTPLHKIWLGIKGRCYNKNNISYKNYGGRGIKLSNDWLDFQNFYNDMSSAYKSGMTIERVNVNKDYSKENCIWIPRSEQSRNRTNTIWVDTEFGKMTVTEAAKKAGVSWFCMYNRVLKNCPPDKLFLPSGKVGRKI